MASPHTRPTSPRVARARLVAIKASGTWGSALSVSEPAQGEGGSDHIAEVTIIGTAITYFTRSKGRPERPSLATVSLDRDRREGAAAAASRPGQHHLINPFDLKA